MTAATPAAAWMDRLSDRIGSLIPGGYRLPPRHPLKVSLVTGQFGYLSGWLTVLPWFTVFFWGSGLELLSFPFAFILLTSLSMFGLVVLVPIWLWCGRRLVPSVLVNGLLSILIHVAGIATLIGIRFPNTNEMDFVNLAPPCAVVSLGFALYVTRMTRCRVWKTISVAVVFGTLIGGLSISVIESSANGIEIWLPNVGLSGDLAKIFSSGFSYGIFQSVLACCLGIPLWDATPLPKFEPEENSPSPEPDE